MKELNKKLIHIIDSFARHLLMIAFIIGFVDYIFFILLFILKIIISFTGMCCLPWFSFDTISVFGTPLLIYLIDAVIMIISLILLVYTSNKISDNE